MTELEQKFLGVLQLAVKNKSSDIHLVTGQPPAIRGHDGLATVNLPPLSAEEMMHICQIMVTEPQARAKLNEVRDYDGSFEVKGLGRFRVNIFRNISGIGAVLRVIAQKVPSIDELKLPKVLCKIAESGRGLILVTGATGSGKSSTLAAMINHLNETESLHILTVEDPVEFLHPQKKSRLTQREIGRDTASFATALKSALRQDPDVILVGEMRDYETLDIALKAAETGHLVFSTVHTSDAMKTIGRLISLFPTEEQTNARIRLADNLHSIISQRLIKGKDGARIVAQEILINNLGISECIMNEQKTFEIPGFIEKGHEVSGMQTFDQHLAFLVQKGEITIDTALAAATNPTDFQRNLSFGDSAIDGGANGSNQLDAGIVMETTEVKPPEAPPPAPATPPPAIGKPPMPKAPPIPGKLKPPGAA